MLTIDIKQQNVFDNGVALILNGKLKSPFKIWNVTVTFDMLEKLYNDYKFSIPNNISYKYNYFKAISADDISVTNLINGKNRTAAKESLELTFLMGVLNGSLKWPDNKKWFWQSDSDKDFVILKDWVIKEGVC